MKILKLICITILAFNATANAVIRNVPSQYSTIQSAILACNNGDTVLVQPGTYFENVNFRNRKIVLTSRFYQSMDLSYISNTIINGGNPQQPDSASCVIIAGGQDSTTVLQGFTLTGGKGTIWNDEHGAGFYREGGGLLVALCSPVIQYNIIRDNQCVIGGIAISTGGGGVRIGDGYVKFFNNIVISNTGRYGAGIVLNYAGGEYKNNIIAKNYGSNQFGAGSGMWLNSSFSRPKTIENNTIVFNTSLSQSPGVNNLGGAATLRNNIIWGNSGGNGTQISGPSMLVTYCNVQGGYTGAGNINAEPLFDSTNYYLRSASPCVDKGDSSTVYNDPADPNNPSLAKWPARGGLRNDMGAYGGPLSKVIANSIVSVRPQENVLLPEDIALSQNFPNPFNPSTTISYQLRRSAYVTLAVYDQLGRIMEVIVDEMQPEGEYSVSFKGADLPTGSYFYRLTAGSQSLVRTMMLIK
jgi:hypothetical protein